jgi:tetratricopeptide (TPR) repeat protein
MRMVIFSVALFAILPLSAQDLAQTGHASFKDKETEALFHEGEKAYNGGAYVKAIGLFTQVIERDKDNLNAYLQRGFCHSLVSQYEEAVRDFSAVIERKGDHRWAYTSRGSAYNKLNKYDLALRDFDTAISMDPKNPEAFQNRGWAKKGLGDAAGACKDWRMSKKLGNGEAKIILENNRCR